MPPKSSGKRLSCANAQSRFIWSALICGILYCRHIQISNLAILDPSTEVSLEIESRVVFSYCLFGRSMDIRLSLENALQYTQPNSIIVAHISVHSIHGDESQDPDWQWITRENTSISSRIHINPLQNKHVAANTGLILRAHLMNFEYIKSLDAESFSYFVLMSADSALVRTGAEDWIRRHKLSFGLGFSRDRRYDLSTYREKIKDRIRSSDPPIVDQGGDDDLSTCNTPTSRPRPHRMMLVGEHRLSPLRKSGIWYKNSTKRAHNGVHGDPEHVCVNFYQHEGTFYPVEVLDRFLDLLRRTNMIETLERAKYFAEEIWLPSYVLKNERSLLLSTPFSPPIVSRFLQTQHQNCCMWSYDDLRMVYTDRLPSSPNGLDSVFGLKFQWPKWGLSLVLLTAQAARFDNKTQLCMRCKNPSGENWIDSYTFSRQRMKRRNELSPLEQLNILNHMPE